MFSNLQQLKDALCDNGYEGSIVFDNPDYVSAAIGFTDDGKVVYDFDLMVESLMEEGMTEDDSIEFIEYNTIRALPYIGENAPIVMRRFEVE